MYLSRCSSSNATLAKCLLHTNLILTLCSCPACKAELCEETLDF